jgi:hypothetical protein
VTLCNDFDNSLNLSEEPIQKPEVAARHADDGSYNIFCG